MSTKELNPVIADFAENLGELSIEDLLDLTKIVNDEQHRRRQDTIQETLARLKLLNISPEDLIRAGGGERQSNKGAQGQAVEKQKVPPKYRNPNNATQVWTGRGNPPSWVRDLDGQGVGRDTYLINHEQEAPQAGADGENGE